MSDAAPVTASSPTVESRRTQAFPILGANEVTRMRRFGTLCRYADGERIYETGKPLPGLVLVLSGAVRVTGRDAHGREIPVVEHVAGAFSGELGLLSGRRSMVDSIAVGAVEAILIDPAQLHDLLIADALLGEEIMRALILRRVELIEAGAGGPVLIGPGRSSDIARLRNFLTRNGMPHAMLDPATDADAQALVARYAHAAADLPLVVCPDGSVLRNPTETELARGIGMLDAAAEDRVFDVAVAGAGPAGLSTAVYGASEGLSVIVIDARAFGGQAGASSRIENYFGFPTGISGQALTARGYTQAQKFGATMMIPSEILRLQCGGPKEDKPFLLELADGRSVGSRTVVIATGARYRRLDCPNLNTMQGRGVWYWASPIEAKLCIGEEVALVGGGNAAGQAAVFLAQYAAKVWMLVRGAGLAATMSKYLIDRIAATEKIQLLTRTQITDVHGKRDGGLEAVTWRNRNSGAEETRPIRNVFLFLGAEPAAEWLRDCAVAVDQNGFVETGSNLLAPLETSVAGVYAVGDIRAGSVKRVGAAIGEGAAVVAQVHAFLAVRASGRV
jgi:thioredoxin reductase (NADPH)